MKRPRGRPPRAEAPVSREEMLGAGLDLLDREGADAFTMRALAERLGINPMTIHHHFRPSVFPQQAERITNEISALLAEAGLPDHRTRLWRDILVDFTHGAALATAMNGRRGGSEPLDDQEFTMALKELSTCLTR